MNTILGRIVERLDKQILRLKRAKKKLGDKKLRDKKLEQQINRLVSIRNRLKRKKPTDGTAN